MRNLFQLSLLLLFLFSACENDDRVVNNEEPLTIEQALAALTSPSGMKVWKFSSATLNNSNVSNLDVSETFNISDDEFIFSLEGENLKLQHNIRNEFNWEASLLNEFLVDNYVSPTFHDLNIINGETLMIVSTDGKYSFKVTSENTVEGNWSLDNGSRTTAAQENSSLSFILEPNINTDVSTILNFEEVSSFSVENSYLSSLGSADFVASQSNNSLYIIYPNDGIRDQNPTGQDMRPEVVQKFDIITGNFERNVYFSQDFFTRRATIYNNQLHVVGTQKINTYSLDLAEEVLTTNYNLSSIHSYIYFRHDTVSIDNEIYIIGGNSELNPFDPQNDNRFDEILKYNIDTQQITEIGNLPSYKAHAGAEVVDGKIYIFGGMQAFAEYDTAESLSYIYDLESGSFSSFNLPEPVHITYTVTVNNIIYVAGEILTTDPNANPIVTDSDIFFGMYNTVTNEFTEIQHNLEDSDAVSKVMGITYLNNQLYVIYGDGSADFRGSYFIMAANISN